MPGKSRIKAPREDYLTYYGASILCQRIEEYWHNAGHRAVRAERYEVPGMPGVWAVTSNLVTGRPASFSKHIMYQGAA